MTERLLEGLSVLITRPRPQSTELQDAVSSHGGTAIVFPVIEIRARPETDILRDLKALADADITIFVSQNAVEHGLRYAKGLLAAVGPTTAAAIEAGGRIVDIRPSSGYDSEHLLQEPALNDVAGKTIRIIRGSSGRELLARTLRARGATVDYLPTYEQLCPDYDAATLVELEAKWRTDGIDAIIIMSVQSLRNLAAVLPDWCHSQLRQTPLVTPAARVLKEALDQYPGCFAILAEGPQIDDIIHAIAASKDKPAGEPHNSEPPDERH